jgi:catechol 2,3-dioxygenase-like lactoylglutathione lyase family enzyme
MAETKTATHITRMGVAMVPVSDQDRAIEFYTEKLGFEKRADTPYGNGDRWVEVAPSGGTTRVALVPATESNPVGSGGTIAFATTDVEADHATLRDHGVEVDEQIMRMGDPVPPMFFFSDQDGNRLLIVQDES